MAAGVPNPGGGGGGASIRFLSAVSITVAGAGRIAVPPGARFVRLMARGGGGGGAGDGANNFSSKGGGQGALQRRFVLLPSMRIDYVVGAGGVGQNGSGVAGGDTSAMGYVARGGDGGKVASAKAKGGVGTDGDQPAFGYGNYNGKDSSGLQAGGTDNFSGGASGSSGAGGNGPTIGSPDSQPGRGGDGYINVEFFG